MIQQTTSAPTPQGTCLQCGATLYKDLVHQCHTTIVIPTKLKELGK